MTEISDLSSAKLLKGLLVKLSDILDKRYTPFPDDARDEFCTAAQHVVFFIGQTLRDLHALKNIDMNWGAALNLAVEIGEYDLAKTAVSKEAELLIEDGADLNALISEISRVLERKGLTANWSDFCDEISRHDSPG